MYQRRHQKFAATGKKKNANLVMLRATNLVGLAAVEWFIEVVVGSRVGCGI